MQGNFLLFSAESLIYARIPEFSFRSRELAGNFRFLGLSHQTAKTYGENGKLLSMLQGISREFLTVRLVAFDAGHRLRARGTLLKLPISLRPASNSSNSSQIEFK
jgi:hypothetical protein